MNTNSVVIEDLNEFLDYDNKTLEEFHATIENTEIAKQECIKNFDFIGA